ncbi:helix-turn-helix domain-containing protein [Paucilactobacillus kaifaensis]|uniref:helix-turn-helix domain-containing protein n=1 Tax=Paucilactobacillus kaifaensis TaxID=2559921 RepID=UPI0010F4E484|nr:helix-turn-helix transcriptional regulator [Paucilactobacillus kaifaensis]
MKIGYQIQTYREQHGLSQTELAAKLHISRQSISKWESGAALPTFANVVAISNLFDISIDDLVRGDLSLMSSLTAGNKEPLSRIFKIFFGGLALGIIIYIMVLAFNINIETYNYWADLPKFILFILILFTINWRQFNRSLSSKTVVLGVILFAIILAPTIFENVSAAIHSTTWIQKGYSSFK